MTSGERPAITVVGSTMIDLVAYATRLPERGETVVGERFQQGFGGKGANQAVMARLMGAEVAMVNAVGDDGYGEQTLANFARHGIDSTHVRRVPGSSGVAPIWVEADGGNRIIIVPGANAGLLPEHAAAAVVAQTRVDAVVGQFEIDQAVTAAAFRAARNRGATTILNPAPGAPVDVALAAVTDWFIPNETEFAVVARAVGAEPDPSDVDALSAVAVALDVRLVVTLGERGAALVARDAGAHLVAAPVVDAVDTTGAGDAFVGAFVYGLTSGWEDVDAVRLGCAIAADSVLRPGTQSSFPESGRCEDIIAETREAADRGRRMGTSDTTGGTMTRFSQLFGDVRPVIAMVHVGATPGTPLYDDARGVEGIISDARADLDALQAAGFDAVMFGNENDRPYEMHVDVAATATLAYVIGRLRPELTLPFGVNMLWDPRSTMALAAATGASFVREIFTGTYASDMGPWTPDAGAALRYGRRLGIGEVVKLYNVSAEFADSLDRRSLPDRARSAVVSSVPDAVLVSGAITGEPAAMSDLEAVKRVLPDTPVMANTGVRHETVADVLAVADGVIVGSALKVGGDTWAAVDRDRAIDFMDRVRATRAPG